MKNSSPIIWNSSHHIKRYLKWVVMAGQHHMMVLKPLLQILHYLHAVKTQELILYNLWLFFFLYEKFITHALCFPFRGILLWERRWLSGGKSVVWLLCQHTVPPDATWTNGTAPLHLLISACLAVCSLPAVLSPAHHIWAETWVNTKKSQMSMFLSPSHLFMFMISLTIGVYCEACLS